jgi:hypothetical protein
MGVPYVGYGNDTLARQPRLAAGDRVRCPNCGEDHIVEEFPPLLLIRCGADGADSFMVGINGRSTMGISPDVHGEVDPPQRICDQKTCESPAVYRFTWPGQGEKGICERHAPMARRAADAVGLYLELVPLVPVTS